jgi:hypothetical protein
LTRLSAQVFNICNLGSCKSLITNFKMTVLALEMRLAFHFVLCRVLCSWEMIKFIRVRAAEISIFVPSTRKILLLYYSLARLISVYKFWMNFNLGNQMSLWKNCPKRRPTDCLSKALHTCIGNNFRGQMYKTLGLFFYVLNSSPK